jgi:O6-methylguanine-DNA--protein-cysteine methyltransferase
VPRGRRAGWNISSDDAKEFLQHLIQEGKVAASEVGRFFEIRNLERRLAELRGTITRRRGRPPASASASSAPSSTGGGKRKRSKNLTPQQRASRQLQGRYLGLIRQIPASQRARYAKVAKDKGRESAIKEMQSALNK